MTILLICNTMTSGFVAAIWSKSNFANALIKVSFLCLFAANAITLAKTINFI